MPPQVMRLFPSICYLYKYLSLIIAASFGLVSSRVWAWTLLLTLLTGRLLAWLGRRRPNVGTGHHPVPLFRCWSAGCLSGCTQATSTSWLNHAVVRKTSSQAQSWRITLHRRGSKVKTLLHLGKAVGWWTLNGELNNLQTEDAEVLGENTALYLVTMQPCNLHEVNRDDSLDLTLHKAHPFHVHSYTLACLQAYRLHGKKLLGKCE